MISIGTPNIRIPEGQKKYNNIHTAIVVVPIVSIGFFLKLWGFSIARCLHFKMKNKNPNRDIM